jgi:XRE family aerobic/anaerobic benzoate catabolism transcriptional regulator
MIGARAGFLSPTARTARRSDQCWRDFALTSLNGRKYSSPLRTKLHGLPAPMNALAHSDPETPPDASLADDRDYLAAMGRTVRELRERRGMARKALSQVAGVSERYLAQLEAGDGNASVLLLRNVARALGVALPDLVAARESSVEHRLIRRFLEKLPAHRLEDVVFRLMRDFGQEESSRRKRVALVGLRGAGKSTLGSALANEAKCAFVELDAEIEREAGMTLSEIFLLYGQTGYRRVERRCLERALAAHDRMVLSVGGGIVSEPDTYNVLLLNCYTVWVKATPDEHMARVMAQGDLRPMHGHAEAMDDLKRILDAREPLYRKADATLETSGETPDQSLAKLRRLALA